VSPSFTLNALAAPDIFVWESLVILSDDTHHLST
jgi:hypothetical protein